jgi:hypothetical protein
MELAPRYEVFSTLLLPRSHLDPNILLKTLFSNTLSLLSFLKISDQVLHPYKTGFNVFNSVGI